MAELSTLIAYADQRLRTHAITDFPGAVNGLQVARTGSSQQGKKPKNTKEIEKIGAAVDADLQTIRAAAEKHLDLLIVHHGLFWETGKPLLGERYRKWQLLFESDLALYSSHLPLDCHPELGNNAQLAQKLGLPIERTFCPYHGNDIASIVSFDADRTALRSRLEKLFPKGLHALEYGSCRPSRIALLTGSGQSVLSQLQPTGVDTLITGELKQQSFAQAQDEQLNLYACGHYATETFGVCALAQELAERFSLSWEFLPSPCCL